MNLHTNLDLTLLGGVWCAVLGISAVSAAFFCSFPAFWLGFGCCLGNFCGFSYFFLLFSGFLGGVWGAVLGISAISATFFLVFFGFLAEFRALFGEFIRFQLLFSALFQLLGWVWGAVLEILWISAPQDPLTMLPTYGYCTL